ncbi:hypothetical protein DFH09DRAFT_1306880 [Mycena vulgaris]|nr:hypothetical protein DFH09DRAFT_1306880 [Mycena vulgaris]
MRAPSTIATILLAVYVASATIIPKELGNLTTRGAPDKLAVLGALEVFLADSSHLRALSIDPPVAIVTTLTNYDWKGDVGIVPIQFDSWFRFNDDLKIIGYDIETRRFAWLHETIMPSSTSAALNICGAHDQYCTGANQRYTNHAQCMNTLLNVKPLGKVWKMGNDNTLYRWAHFGMIKYRPSVVICAKNEAITK